MTDQPITSRLTEREHCLWLSKAEILRKQRYIHPRVVCPNGSDYQPNKKITWHRSFAQKFVDEYNRDVLGLTPGQVQAIVESSMFGKTYPDNYNKGDFRSVDEKGWPSDGKSATGAPGSA